MDRLPGAARTPVIGWVFKPISVIVMLASSKGAIGRVERWRCAMLARRMPAWVAFNPGGRNLPQRRLQWRSMEKPAQEAGVGFGIGIATSHDSWKLAQRAEELGFPHACFFDTQMITADCFVAMGAAALKTSRIRLGTGVLVPSNRIAAVTANAFATLNGMAPGRIDFGVGTGFSARRAMGLGAMKLADMEEYIRVVYALLNGETTEAEVDPGVRKKIRFLNPELGLINIKDPIRLHISALGPKGRQMTARHGAAWKTVMSGVDDGLAALRGMKKTWADSGRPASELYSSAWVWGCVLKDGETLDSPRVRAQTGPRAAVLLHRAADLDMEGWKNTSPVPDSVKDVLQGYVEMARKFEPADARYLMNHTGHCIAVKSQEERFVTSELI